MGSNFCLPNINKKLAIHEFIKDIESNSKRNNINNRTTIRNIAIPKFAQLLNTKEKQDLTQQKLLSAHKEAVRFCKENPNIIFTRADKGNVTVAMDKSYYINKIENLLSDVNTYAIINKNPCKKIEKELNNLLKKWLKNDFISKKEYYKLYSNDSLLPKAYGLPKIHKVDTPFRIIVSSLDTALYSLASFIHKILLTSLLTAKSHINKFRIVQHAIWWNC